LKQQKPSSGDGKTSILDMEESATTKNKITNNKTTKTFTNRINAGTESDDWYDYANELEEKIDTFRHCYDETDRYDCIKDIHKFLCNIVSKFKGFTMSEKDKALIAQTEYDGIFSYKIADKIISNAKAIIDGRKESRFGNLFVGIKQMNEEYELNYG